jgi:hypothetical protein
MDGKEFEAMLSDVEVRLERLRSLYEQWFQGIERIEPTVARKEVERRMQALRKAQPKNTALRFRFQTLWQRYTTFTNYWNRIGRQIEEGTYQRDVMRARQRRQEARDQRRRRRVDEAEGPEVDIDVDIDELDVDAEIEQALGSLESSEGQGEPAPAAASSEASASQSEQQPSSASRRPARNSISPFALGSKRPAAPSQDPQRAAASGSSGADGAAASASAGAPSGQSSQGAAVTATFSKPKDPRRSASQGQSGGGATGSKEARSQAAAPAGSKHSGERAAASAKGAGNRAAGRSKGGTAVGEERLRRLYNEYLEARRRNNERTDNVRYETMAKSVQQMVPKLQQKHKGKNIDFEVVVKNGRVGIKPKPSG